MFWFYSTISGLVKKRNPKQIVNEVIVSHFFCVFLVLFVISLNIYLSLNIIWLLPCFFSLPLISMCFMTREEENEIIRIVKKFPDLSHLAVKIRPTLLVVLSGFFHWTQNLDKILPSLFYRSQQRLLITALL